MRYCIAYTDMYGYGCFYNGRSFTTAADAISNVRKALDQLLQREFVPGMTSGELYERVMTFDEVLICSLDDSPPVDFSGKAYVLQRCEEMCGQPPEQPHVATAGEEGQMTKHDPRQSNSSFPPGSTFWNFKDVPVLMDKAGRCTAWDQSEVTHEQLFNRGTQISESDFFDLVQSLGRLKHSTYPAGTSFAELDGVLVVIDRYGICTAIDGSFCSKTMLHDGGTYLTEAAFLALVAIHNAKRQ